MSDIDRTIEDLLLLERQVDSSWRKSINIVIQLLQEKQAREAEPQPRALALEELKEREGKPVWIEDLEVKTRSKYFIIAQPNPARYFETCNDCPFMTEDCNKMRFDKREGDTTCWDNEYDRVIALNDGQYLLYREYNKTWLPYDREPERGGE